MAVLCSTAVLGQDGLRSTLRPLRISNDGNWIAAPVVIDRTYTSLFVKNVNEPAAWTLSNADVLAFTDDSSKL
jgi:hypothetical protein